MSKPSLPRELFGGSAWGLDRLEEVQRTAAAQLRGVFLSWADLADDVERFLDDPSADRLPPAGWKACACCTPRCSRRWRTMA